MGCFESKVEPAPPEPGLVAVTPFLAVNSIAAAPAPDLNTAPTAKPEPRPVDPPPTAADNQSGAPPPPATAPTPKPQPSSKLTAERASSSTLTAEQQAQWEAKLKLIVEQLAKPSKWDTPFKDRYGFRRDLNASACKQALRYTKFLNADYLAELADLGQPVPRCQDVPAWAVVTLQEMEESGLHEMLLSALIISYPWLDADHPDIDGAQLRRLAFVLKAFANAAGQKEGGKCGVFWDYCSCAAASIAPAPHLRVG